MIHNAKLFVRALLAQDLYTQLAHLTKLKSAKHFNKSFLHTTELLLACRDSRHVNDTDRKDLEQHKGSLEREHVRYLLGVDQELIELIDNPMRVPVFFCKMEFSFGSISGDRDVALHQDRQIQAFKAHPGQAIFVINFGVVNHWISVVVHKPDANTGPQGTRPF